MIQRFTFTLLSIWFLLSVRAYGQDTNYTLFGEGNEQQVKLLWVVKNWPDDLTGFTVKRRAITNGQASAWEAINTSPVLPGLHRFKSLTNLNLSAIELQVLAAKLRKLLKEGKTKEIATEEYLQKLRSDPTAMKGLLIPFALDFDFALLNGFGIIDHALPKADRYEFALFPVDSEAVGEEAVATYNWQFGTKPDLSIPLEIKLNPSHSRNWLELEWLVDASEYTAKAINGFNVYRKKIGEDFTKLNTNPIWLTTDLETGKLSFHDEQLKEETVYTYAVAPISLFGTEGAKVEIEFDPSKLPPRIDPPGLIQVPDEEYDERGIAFKWDFDQQAEAFIKGFYLERKMHVDDEFKPVSGLLSPTSRYFVDIQIPKEKDYYFYRLRVIDEQKLNLVSNDLFLFYQPIIRPSKPTGLKAEWLKEYSKSYILLTWDKAIDIKTQGYHLYTNFPPEQTLLLEANIPRIDSTQYKYEIHSAKSARYRFAIAGVSNTKEEGPQSEPVEVVTPSVKVPNVNIWPFSVDSNTITLEWQYEPLSDLKGFRIFVDGKLIADEKILNAQQRKWTSPPLEYNKTYRFTMQAVTLYGSESRPSLIRTISTEKKKSDSK